MMVPYFPPVIESLKGFLTDTRDEMRSLQTQALGRDWTCSSSSSVFSFYEIL